LAQKHGYNCVLGSAYPHDPMHPPVWYIKWLIKKNLVPGTIVILHDGISNPTRSIQALPDVLVEGRKKGLTFVAISELLRRANQSP
jgi:peptidoglycan/xylan/chitin deacetylase (PgdA/CDA1 family)